MVGGRDSLKVQRKGGAAGFTLVEVLVSLVLTAVIFVSAYEVIGTLVQYQKRLEARYRVDGDLRLLENLVEQIVGQAVHVSDLPRPEGKESYFDGKSDSIRLLSRAYSRNFDVPGYRIYRLFVRNGELVVSHAKYGLPPARRVFRETPTGLQLQRLELAYWGEHGWQGQWQDARRLPRYIRLRLTLPDGQQTLLVRETARP